MTNSCRTARIWIDAVPGDDAETCVIFENLSDISTLRGSTIDVKELSRKQIRKKIGRAAETQAKYKALIQALQLIVETRPKNVVIYTDSHYIIGQMTKKWRVDENKPSHVRLMNRANYFLKKIRNYKFIFLPKTELKKHTFV